MNTNRWMSHCLALTFVIAAVGCSDQQATSGVPPAPQRPGRPTPVQPMMPVAETPAVKTLQGVVELTLTGLADADAAAELERGFEGVPAVERATVDYATGKAKILLRASVRREDAPDALEALRERVSKPATITAFSYEFHESGSARLRW